jgi:molecular chaperone DnaK (HSP70)
MPRDGARQPASPRPRGDLQIEVSFQIDVDGILHVSATAQVSGMPQEAHLHVLGAPVGGP